MIVPIQCCWCHHADTQHDHADPYSNPLGASPCRVSGCDCDEYEADD